MWIYSLIFIISIFTAVLLFVYLFKRKKTSSIANDNTDLYVCTQCGEDECICHKE